MVTNYANDALMFVVGFGSLYMFKKFGLKSQRPTDNDTLVDEKLVSLKYMRTPDGLIRKYSSGSVGSLLEVSETINQV